MGRIVGVLDEPGARAHANPLLIAFAYFACGQAYTESDPDRALDIFREGLAYTRQHRLPLFEAGIARDAAGLEAAHGDLDQALDLFSSSIDSFHQSGATTYLARVFAHMTVFFDRTGRPEIAATFYGTTTNNPVANEDHAVAAAVDHLRNVLGIDIFDSCARAGAAMTLPEAVRYAHHQIALVRPDRT